MTVLEEEVVERTASPMRRFVVRRPTGADDAGLEEPRPSNLPVTHRRRRVTGSTVGRSDRRAPD